MKAVLILLVLCGLGFALIGSQTGREWISGLTDHSAERAAYMSGRRIFLSTFKAAPTAKFSDYDGLTSRGAQVDDTNWMAIGTVEYDWLGSRRREPWVCVFERDTLAAVECEIGGKAHVIQQQIAAHPRGHQILKPVAVSPKSTSSSIEGKWGWKTHGTSLDKKPGRTQASPSIEPGYHYERSGANGNYVPVRDGSSWRRSVGGG